MMYTYTSKRFITTFITTCLLYFTTIDLIKISAQTSTLQHEVKIFFICDKKVEVHQYRKKGDKITFAHVHENEHTSLEVGLNYVQKYGGHLLTLVHTTSDSIKNRNISFTYQGKVYYFDPNRIFSSDIGILRSAIKMKNHSTPINDKTLLEVKALADYIWTSCQESPLILALHNNKNEPASIAPRWFLGRKIESESYSILSYAQKCGHKSVDNQSCKAIYITPEINNSEFFITTQKSDFDFMVRYNHSVVLQNDNPIDDGSMSVKAALTSKRYINAEAKHGAVIQQTFMLDLIHSLVNGSH